MKFISGNFRHSSVNVHDLFGNFPYIFPPPIWFKVAIPHLLCPDEAIKLKLRSWDQSLKCLRQFNELATPQVEHALLYFNLNHLSFKPSFSITCFNAAELKSKKTCHTRKFDRSKPANSVPNTSLPACPAYPLKNTNVGMHRGGGTWDPSTNASKLLMSPKRLYEYNVT